MKQRFFHAGLTTILAGACVLMAAPASAQSPVYRCGNEYTNRPAGRKNCTPVTGGNVTVVEGGTPPVRGGVRAVPRAASVRPATASNDTISASVQQRRDNDRKTILERELQRAQSHQTELEAEYKNGEPDKIGGEAHNYQKYLDRVAQMKAALERNQSDITGIQRELDRVAPAATTPAPQ